MMNTSRFVCVGVSAAALLCCGDVWAAARNGVPAQTSNLNYNLLSAELSASIGLPETQKRATKVASVCFITDAGNCTGAAGVGTDEGPSSSSGGPDWEIDGKEQCEQSGYDCTPCPEGQKPSGTCPFDSSCHATCVNACPVENTLTCTGADEKGVGDACDGLYASCCKLCSDYPYDEIKAGYVLTDSCKDCDGNTHYKLKCDVWGQGSGMGTYFDCGDSGGAGGSRHGNLF